jgi:hypothetical protein
MNRYKEYLSKNIPKYLEYDIFDEIVIVDENGLDKYQLDQVYKGHPKVKIYTNDMRLGAFKNKLKAISLAKNDWVYLLDSDNFIGPDFHTVLAEFTSQTVLSERTIYCPETALINWNPQPATTFDYLTGVAMDKDVIKRLCIEDFGKMEFFLNAGNFLLHKSVLGYDYKFWDEQINQSKCYDTIFFIFLMTYRRGMTLQIVPGLKYNYAAHEDSYYILNNNLKEVQEFYKKILFLIANDK